MTPRSKKETLLFQSVTIGRIAVLLSYTLLEMKGGGRPRLSKTSLWGPTHTGPHQERPSPLSPGTTPTSDPGPGSSGWSSGTKVRVGVESIWTSPLQLIVSDRESLNPLENREREGSFYWKTWVFPLNPRSTRASSVSLTKGA